MVERILKLSDSQIAELFEKVWIVFGVQDSQAMQEVIKEIRDKYRENPLEQCDY